MSEGSVTITLRLLGPLRHYLPPGSGFDDCQAPLREGDSVATVIDSVALPAGEQFMVLLNGERVEPDAFAATRPAAGDEVTLVPPIKGG